MTATLILVLFALCGLLFFLFRLRGYREGSRQTSNLADRLVSVDLDAFRNLVDPDEEEFLRSHLPPPSFAPSSANASTRRSTTSPVSLTMPPSC